LASAAPTVAMAKRRRAPTQSARVRTALMAAAATNPRVTAMDSHACAAGDIQAVLSEGITAVAENQSERAPSSARQMHSSMRHRRGSGIGGLF
jgi:hypothetical protein